MQYSHNRKCHPARFDHAEQQEPCIQLIAGRPGARKPSIWSLAAASYSTGMADDNAILFDQSTIQLWMIINSTSFQTHHSSWAINSRPNRPNPSGENDKRRDSRILGANHDMRKILVYYGRTLKNSQLNKVPSTTAVSIVQT